MKKIVLLCAVCATVHLSASMSMWRTFDEMDHYMHEMHKQMEAVFVEMNERAQSYKVEAPDYDISFDEQPDTLQVKLSVPPYVALTDISVEVEDGALDVFIRSESETVELKIAGQMLNITAVKKMKHERKDDKGQVHSFSSGSSHMAQSVMLPVKVDLYRTTPQADLTDGVLSLTLSKKGAQKINVTASHVTKPAAPVAHHTNERKSVAQEEDLEDLLIK